MTLVSRRLFHNNLGNFLEFFGQVVHSLPLPPTKNGPHTYDIIGLFDPSFSITDTETINKLRQDISGQTLRCSGDYEAPDIMFICSMVYFCTPTYIEAVRYIFISKICFCASMVQIADLCCKVKINSYFFVSFWSVLVSDVSTNYYCFMRFIYLQDLKVFFISVMVTSVTVFG